MYAQDWLHVVYRLLPLLTVVGTLYFAFSLHRARRFFRRLQKDGMPMPPHHPLFGHLGLTASIMMKMPRDVMPTIAMGDQIRLRYPHLDRAFYLDNWPFAPPMLIVTSPNLMDQFTKEESLPKVAGLADYMRPMSGGHDILTMEGPEWSRWRAVFQPSFTGRDLMRYVPGLVTTVGIFRDALRDHAARGDMFLLGPMTLKLAMDMAGKAIWNHQFNSQTSDNAMVDAVVSQLGWLYFREFSWDKVNPARLFMHRYNAWKMNRYILRVFPSSWWQKQAVAVGSQGGDKTAPSSSVIGKAVETFLTNHGREAQDSKLLRNKFDHVLNSQLRFFLLAGYDTTGSSIVYVFHLLQHHPKILARVRQELDRVLGTDVEAAPSLITEQPHLLNKVPYLTAVIKETLRLYPPASTVRTGRAGFHLVNREGPGRGGGEDSEKAAAVGFPARLPTEGCILFANHHGLHHNPRYWKRPEEFLPERFLSAAATDGDAGAGDPGVDVGDLRPVPGAWRPFERGPRLCVGQELAMAEIKLVCMLTLRELDVVDAYHEFDSDLEVVGKKALVTTVNGDRAYQITRGGGSHPSDWYPCRAKLATHVYSGH